MSLKKPDIDFGGTTDQVDWYPECGMWGLRNKDALVCILYCPVQCTVYTY